jgi:hypothetical protein
MQRMELLSALGGYVAVLLVLAWLRNGELGILDVVTVTLGYSAVWVLFSALPRRHNSRR